MERLIRLEEVQRITSLSESDIRRRMKAGEFPERIVIGPKRVAWSLSDINAWVERVTGTKPKDEGCDVDQLSAEGSISRYLDRIEENEAGCWIWTGTKSATAGYGNLKKPRTRTTTSAHRVIYTLIKGPDAIPEGYELDHKCRERLCVNPDHLEPVTHKENMQRAALHRVYKLKTHCKRGHEYTPENTQLNPRGNRHCKQCQKISQQNRKNRNATDE